METEVLEENLLAVPLCPSQIPLFLTWGQSQAITRAVIFYIIIRLSSFFPQTTTFQIQALFTSSGVERASLSRRSTN
jgi:hypothetical protein